ncbi:biotin synthesis protein [Bordetella pertussis]|nr:biotin synthesis protein [Bordetella pertussis]
MIEGAGGLYVPIDERHIPRLARVDAEAVEAWAARIPPLADCLARRWPDPQETPACRP